MTPARELRVQKAGVAELVDLHGLEVEQRVVRVHLGADLGEREEQHGELAQGARAVAQLRGERAQLRVARVGERRALQVRANRDAPREVLARGPPPALAQHRLALALALAAGVRLQHRRGGHGLVALGDRQDRHLRVTPALAQLQQSVHKVKQPVHALQDVLLLRRLALAYLHTLLP